VLKATTGYGGRYEPTYYGSNYLGYGGGYDYYNRRPPPYVYQQRQFHQQHEGITKALLELAVKYAAIAESSRTRSRCVIAG
jgi:hypothetical protein